MGTWGTGIFDDDLSLDVKGEFEDAISKGLSVMEATTQTIEAFSDTLEDDYEGSIVFLTLAVLQLEQGCLQNDIKLKALEIIDTGKGFEGWEDADSDLQEERKKTLEELKQKILLQLA